MYLSYCILEREAIVHVPNVHFGNPWGIYQPYIWSHILYWQGQKQFIGLKRLLRLPVKATKGPIRTPLCKCFIQKKSRCHTPSMWHLRVFDKKKYMYLLYECADIIFWKYIYICCFQFQSSNRSFKRLSVILSIKGLYFGFTEKCDMYIF